MQVSKHAEKMIRKRLGVPRSAVEKLAGQAFAEGKSHADVSGSLKRFLDRTYLKYESASNMRIYRDFLFLFSGETLVTVYILPEKYR